MIHKEGYPTLLLSALILTVLSLILQRFAPSLFIPLTLLFIGLFLFLVSFFRNPNRTLTDLDDNVVYAPADGKVVVIENTEETEYLKTKVKQVSIFMSPLNVHVNRNPVGGEVEFAKYHPGSFLPAWEPKASTENERTTIVYKSGQGKKILMRQIAGALAKRIVFYVKSGDKIKQGDDMGFIKFGSRVDLYLPLDAEINVSMNQMVEGNRTIIAKI
jgi:phosphatidylserine decarboxylase